MWVVMSCDEWHIVLAIKGLKIKKIQKKNKYTKRERKHIYRVQINIYELKENMNDIK